MSSKVCNYGSSPSAARNLHILLDKLRQTRIPLKKSQKTVGCLLCPYCFFTICIICITLEYNTIVITAIIICIEPEKKIFCKIMYNKIDAVQKKIPAIPLPVNLCLIISSLNLLGITQDKITANIGIAIIYISKPKWTTPKLREKNIFKLYTDSVCIKKISKRVSPPKA